MKATLTESLMLHSLNYNYLWGKKTIPHFVPLPEPFRPTSSWTISGDIELNPVPEPSSFKYFSICHWNLSSITSNDVLKVKLLTACNVMHKFGICISESYLNPDTSSSDDNLNIPGYNMSLAHHPSGNWRRGVCICYKESLPNKMLNKDSKNRKQTL